MRHALRFTNDGHDDVRLLRRVHRFVNHRFRRARIDLHRFLVLIEESNDIVIVSDVRSFGVNHFRVFPGRVFNPGQHSHGLVGHACRRPAPHHVTLAVGQRANHGNGAGFLQRQRLQAVFQQHQAFARHVAGFFTVQSAFRVGIHRV